MVAAFFFAVAGPAALDQYALRRMQGMLVVFSHVGRAVGRNGAQQARARRCWRGDLVFAGYTFCLVNHNHVERRFSFHQLKAELLFYRNENVWSRSIRKLMKVNRRHHHFRSWQGTYLDVSSANRTSPP